MSHHFSEFYHGTDARILRMSTIERQSYIKFSKEVVDTLGAKFLSLFQIDHRLLMFKEQLGDCYELFVDSIQNVYMNKIGYDHYQYDKLYVTTWKPDAVMYSVKSYVFGKIGLMAYGIILDMMAIAKAQGNSLDMFLPMKLNNREVRAVWDDENNCWWFSAIDVVRAINDDPDYTKADNYYQHC